MKSAFKEFAKKKVSELRGDPETLIEAQFKAHARKLIRNDDAARKAKRKAIKASRKKARK